MRRVEREWCLVDDLLRADVEACCEEASLFPFEDACLAALLAFSRDSTVLARCAALPHEPISESGRAAMRALEGAGTSALRVALPLIRFGFASVASPSDTLALWDRVVAFNSTEVLAAAAAAVFLQAAERLAGLSGDTTAAEADAADELGAAVRRFQPRGGVVACLRQMLEAPSD
ncbi:hypothetical protein FNF27_06060 [Cafeteria roenbergensis]|uniref:Rab-GAP TBC domain-containing protein n=1 Tax=Cafeteria roenbergensis TaxID=33653 RepID=A0A5A8E6L8_CAFRO|nr:hypothetical protein FNF27_06060 [Cafeteria roenbergensis]